MKIEWFMLGLGVSMVIGGLGMFLVVLRPQTTWQELAWVAKWAWMLVVPGFILAMGCVVIWAALSRGDSRG